MTAEKSFRSYKNIFLRKENDNIIVTHDISRYYLFFPIQAFITELITHIQKFRRRKLFDLVHIKMIIIN